MWQALVQLLPIALAAALSMVPIMATILILVSDKRDESALPYATGWVLGAAVFVTLTTVAASFVPEGRPRHRAHAIAVAEVVIGVALVLLAVVTLVRRRSEDTRQIPGWMSRVDSLDSLPAFGLGLALNVRPKAFLLAVAAGLILHNASLQPEFTLVGVAFFTIVATSTVVVPVLLTLLSPTRMQPRLQAARTRLADTGPVVTAVAMLVVGILMLLLGFGDL
jgi:Sap, sulfolipid-1-addressing protein